MGMDMKKRTRFFLGLLAATIVIAAAVVGDSRILTRSILIAGFVWFAWRVFVFLALLLRPVRNRIKPVNDHLDKSLRDSGLGVIADAASKLQAGIDSVVDASTKKHR